MGDVDIKVNPEIIKPIIEKKIQAALVEALGGQEELIEKTVVTFLNMRVSDSGQPSTYGSISLMQWFAKHAIQKAMRAALAKWVDAKHDDLVRSFERQWKASSKTVAEQMILQLVENSKNPYQMKVDLKLERCD